jgi:alcohol dehydrogenase
MACGDPKAAFKIAILDPLLTTTQPRTITAIAGYDALSHAVESYVTMKRTEVSDMYSREAWRLLDANYERVLAEPGDLAARGAMLLGAYHAGVAIEQSMLGATHACANPLTARYGTIHGVAIAVMLPHVARWNASVVDGRYAELMKMSGRDGAGDDLAARLDALARIGRLPSTLRELGVARKEIPALATDAGGQWTGTFNPKPFDAAAARELYERAF